MSIHVKLLYFGQARDAAGIREERLSFPDGASVSDLMNQVSTAHERMGEIRRIVKVAVNEEMAEPDQTLHDGDDVAILPPVAGGRS